MSAPMSKLLLAVRNCSQVSKFAHSGMMNLCYRTYGSDRKRKKPRPKDPRQNVQYPYTPGDPYHEDLIETKRSRSQPGFADYKGMSTTNTVFVDDRKHVTQYGHIYEKLKEGDLRLGRTILKAKSSNDPDTILLEGYRLIKDSILLRAEIKNLYFSEEEALKDFSLSLLKDTQIFKIPYKDMKTWSGTTTPSGILGVFKKPQKGEVFSYQKPCLPLTLILDEIKDPGNVGTLIRTAAAVGCERILALRGCVDVWEGKVLRSGMGSHFAIPIYNKLSWSEVSSYIKDNTQVLLADARTENYVKMNFDNKLSIDQVKEASSESDSDTSSSDSDEEDNSSENFSSNRIRTAPNDIYNRVPFPLIPYSNLVLHTSADSGEEHSIALVIGNETEGLSLSAKKFAYNCYGTFVTIPMNPAVDSLNTAIAGSILLYEIHRKLSCLGAPSVSR